MTSVIEFEGVWKSYRKHVVLQSISFQISPGAIVALVGRVGVGKSTMLQLLAGLRQPDRGRVLVENQKPSSDGKFLASIGFVDQGPALPQKATLSTLERIGRSTNPYGTSRTSIGLQSILIFQQTARSVGYLEGKATCVR